VTKSKKLSTAYVELLPSIPPEMRPRGRYRVLVRDKVWFARDAIEPALQLALVTSANALAIVSAFRKGGVFVKVVDSKTKQELFAFEWENAGKHPIVKRRAQAGRVPSPVRTARKARS